MNAEESHYLKRLKILQKSIEDKVSQSSRISSGRNYLGTATWNRKGKLFDIHHILISSKYKHLDQLINHLEVDCLEKIEDLKTQHDMFYIFTKLSPCEKCFQILTEWTQKNKFNMIVLGIGNFQGSTLNLLKEKKVPNNLLIFDLTKDEMLKKEERSRNMNETYTKETFEELLERMDGIRRNQKNPQNLNLLKSHKHTVLKPIINSPKLPSRVKMNNFVKSNYVDLENEKVIIKKLLKMKKSKDDLLSDSSLNSSPATSGGLKRHKHLHPIKSKS